MLTRHWKRWFGIALVALSLAIYCAEMLIFQTPRDTLFYLVQDLAFLPISVLFVTLILSEVLELRDRRVRLHKLNMVIGAFFSEVGTVLLGMLSTYDTQLDDIRADVRLEAGWTDEQFAAVRLRLAAGHGVTDSRRADLAELRDFLAERRVFILALLQNPSLLEHESFSELLWAVLHLTEELVGRPSLVGLPEPDLNHLSGDISRAYRLLMERWLAYMDHLSQSYPYLYSLAVRSNPLDPSAEVVIS